ncbi:hypothetical protein BGZ61DRAFT_157811 [Ilyonectria robusta]|uniref:uncharacterized protein n=1 Tax=Ilyonectria robusta TaxID=1079257 RepID=UPI001E8CBB4C|nr:uncharacterized protein BGZ61DRAFT_157811 [Ilyonectria robusta]KAH8733356.1 hypothetical protein BGZ61DRAFT_157811 [Ilyonectria robusta]
MYPEPHTIRLVPTRLSAATFFRRPCATPFARCRVAAVTSQSHHALRTAVHCEVFMKFMGAAGRTCYGTVKYVNQWRRSLLSRWSNCCDEVQALLWDWVYASSYSVAQAIGYQGHQLNWAALENYFKPTRLQRPSTPSSDLISSLLVLSRPFGV